jgi:hypothetical protein
LSLSWRGIQHGFDRQDSRSRIAHSLHFPSSMSLIAVAAYGLPASRACAASARALPLREPLAAFGRAGQFDRSSGDARFQVSILNYARPLWRTSQRECGVASPI